MLTCPTCHHQYPTSEQFCSRDGATLLAPDGAAADATLRQIIPGGYQIEERLGEGGMGIVYRVTRLSDQQTFAVKILRTEYAQNQDILTRFYQEARAVSQLQHPNIAQVIDTGTLPDGRPYLLLEYLRGADLAAVLLERGALSEPEIIEIALQATSALQTAHEAGIIHRDLKPDNIFLCQTPNKALHETTGSGLDRLSLRNDGGHLKETNDQREEAYASPIRTTGSSGTLGTLAIVKLLDFGLAKLLRKSSDEISREEARTRSGVIMGTPYYMSPEQACGKPVDEQTDLYAFGVILYEMLVGRVPFRSPDGPLHVLMQHLNEAPIAPSELQLGVSPAFEQLILHCLAKEKSQRYQSAKMLHQDLLSLQRGEALSFRPSKPKKSNQPLALVLSAVGAVAVMGSWYAFAERDPVVKTPTSWLAPPPETRPTTTISAASTPTRPTLVALTIETRPEGAQVLLDGVMQEGVTPLVLSVPMRENATLMLLKDGFEDSTQSISLSSSLVLKLPLTKVKKKNTNTSTTPPDQLDPYKGKKP